MRLHKGSKIGARRMPFAKVGQIDKRTIPPAEANPWWWHPSRIGVPTGAPSYFARQLAEVDPDLEVTQNRFTGKWQVWIKKSSLQSKTCWGWQLLFTEDQLGPWTLARLYQASARKWGNALEYWRAIEREIEGDRERKHIKSQEYAVERAREIWDYSRIKNIGKGSKFSTYHQ